MMLDIYIGLYRVGESGHGETIRFYRGAEHSWCMAKKEDRVYTTTAFRQNGVSRSVRSTIPEAVAVLLGVENGTTVEWRVDGETRRVWVRAAKK